ncbi:MAG: type VII secretion protein EssC [Lachnospiraceae bacterium]|nr:type VII secretion protein EssC [Lachnospiraceae bacterium]
MAIILCVYTSSTFREIWLPVTNNSNYSVALYKNVYGLKKDVILKLEVVNDAWVFLEDPTYSVIKESESYERKTLQNGDVIQIYTENEVVSVLVRKITQAFHVFQKISIENQTAITIGKNETNLICYDYSGLVSREHAILTKGPGGWQITNKGTNGLCVNTYMIRGSYTLRFGDYINIFGLHIVFLGDLLAIDTGESSVVLSDVLKPYEYEREQQQQPGRPQKNIQKDSRVLIHRAPRNIEKIEKETIEIEPPPALGKSKKQPLLMTVGPALTMALPMALGCMLMTSGGGSSLASYSGLIMALSSAAVGVIWAVLAVKNQDKEDKEAELHRFEAYSRYLQNKSDEVREKYESNIKAMHIMYQSAQECLGYVDNTTLLWNRNQRHEDFIYPRLGIGDLPFQANIAVAKKKFTLYDDSLEEKPRMIRDNFKTLYNVPICVDLLKDKLIGLVGGEYLKGAHEVVKNISVQIAANNCYTDVKMAFIYDAQNSANLDKWDFVKWFPHVWSEDKKIRYVASDKNEASDVLYELAKIFRHRDESEASKKPDVCKPYFILFLLNPELMAGELISKYVFDTGKNYGLTTFILSETQENLPNDCEVIIENDDKFKGIFNVSAQKDERIAINFDAVDDSELGAFAGRLSNYYVTETGTGGDIPTSLTFFEMFGATKLSDLNVLDRWIKNRTYDNIKGVIGQKAGGADCYLDLHEKYHGPHGLVAGTTGSGKSETLQTYMLSLALNYSPDDIGYFIIDYKGGGMANLFNGLPHLIGQISNLSGNQVHRAMVSIKSENRRRQRVFNEYGVNNINLYTKLYKNKEASMPIPHLFIIIDEFAELKREEPDFMRELISVAQVGRSLGVHLILATQKPSGTVDDNIWSNSKFRLCLRVQDRQDSNDMLHKPDAAYITQAGRAYLQVGNDEVFELFQSGFSGAAYEEEDGSGKTDIASLYTLTGKIDMSGSYAKVSQKEKLLYNWLTEIKHNMLKALETLGFDVTECEEKKSRMSALVAQLYIEFEKNGIDYAESVYNSARLEDYIRLYIEAQKYEEEDIRVMMKLASVRKTKLPQAKEKTQLDAVTEYLAKIAAENGYTHELQLWMPVLPTQMYLEEFEEYSKNKYEGGRWPVQKDVWELDVVIGLMDDPQNQAQMPIHVNFSTEGHLGIFGMVVTGKSTALQTIIYGLISKYTPEYINFYGIDFSSKMMSAYEDCPHFGGVMYEGDYDKIAKFFVMLNDILEERKKTLRGGNYSQYVQVHGVTMPAIIVAIDNFSAFNEKTQEEYVDFIITLSKEGVSHGIYLIITGGGISMADVPSRIAENIKQNICVEMQDKYAYSDILHTMGIEVLPESGVKGRGLALSGGRILEYQVALALEASDDYQRIERIADLCADMKENWNGKCARPIPEIPEKPVWSEFKELEDYWKMQENPALLPVGYKQEDALLYGIDLRQTYCYLITGLARSGKKNYFKVVLQSAMDKNSEICVVDGPGKFMRAYEGMEQIRYVDSDETVFEYFRELLPEFVRRNKFKGQLMEEDLEEEEIFEKMSQEKPIFIFISELAWFINMVYTTEYEMSGFLENIIEKGRLHNIYFIANIKLDEVADVEYRDLFTLFTGHKTGIHFGGNVTENRLFNFDNVAYQEQSEMLKPGIGYTAGVMSQDVRKVVIPLARR